MLERGDWDKINWERARISFAVGAISGGFFSAWGLAGANISGTQIITNEFGAQSAYCTDCDFETDINFEIVCGVRSENPRGGSGGTTNPPRVMGY